MKRSGADAAASSGGSGISGRTVGWLALGYVVLYAVGYLAKPIAASAPIWPADSVSFIAYLLLPFRFWPLIALGMVSAELASVPVLNWLINLHQASLAGTLGFASANILVTAIPAGLSRLLGLFRDEGRFQLAISPVWIIALFGGVLPGAFLGAMTRAHTAGVPFAPADMGLWGLASVLTIVTFGPTIFGMLVGFSEPARALARTLEGWAVSAIIVGLFTWFALVPWPVVNQRVEPMLFAVPLVWLALRFSRRATSIAVAIVASGVVLLAGYGAASQRELIDVDGWRAVVISIDIFLLICCGGALLVNLMTLTQRALLEELAREQEQLLQTAQALDYAEDSARRATAADLHDGVGQVLAGQSMTLAAMRAHASHPLLAALIEEAAIASREAQEGLRVMIQNLSPPELEHASLEETLQWLVDLFRTRFGFGVTYRITGTEFQHDQLHLVYRCIRELLMNAYKHSQRKSAEVEVEVSSTSVGIIVIDEGIGFDARRVLSLTGPRFGLEQLRARVHAAGGALEIETIVGEGCRVTVQLPSPSPATG